MDLVHCFIVDMKSPVFLLSGFQTTYLMALSYWAIDSVLPKVLLLIITVLYYAKALGVEYPLRSRGERWNSLDCHAQKSKHFPAQIINLGLNHRFKPYLEVRSYVNTWSIKSHVLGQLAKWGACQMPQSREGHKNPLVHTWPRQSHPIATFSPWADFNEQKGERVTASF